MDKVVHRLENIGTVSGIIGVSVERSGRGGGQKRGGGRKRKDGGEKRKGEEKKGEYKLYLTVILHLLPGFLSVFCPRGGGTMRLYGLLGGRGGGGGKYMYLCTNCAAN